MRCRPTAAFGARAATRDERAARAEDRADTTGAARNQARGSGGAVSERGTSSAGAGTRRDRGRRPDRRDGWLGAVAAVARPPGAIDRSGHRRRERRAADAPPRGAIICTARCGDSRQPIADLVRVPLDRTWLPALAAPDRHASLALDRRVDPAPSARSRALRPELAPLVSARLRSSRARAATKSVVERPASSSPARRDRFGRHDASVARLVRAARSTSASRGNCAVRRPHSASALPARPSVEGAFARHGPTSPIMTH